MRRLLLCVVLLAGCSSEKEAPPTWHSEMRAVAETKCVGCHVSGGIAPFALESYDDFAARPSLVRTAIADQVMPPWPPKEECTDYQFDRSLDAKTHARFLQWIDDGMELGDPKDYKEPPAGSGGLSRIDLSLDIPVAYTPQVTPDEYRCFMIDWPYDVPQYVTGFRARPGEPAIVHHVIAFLIAPGDVASYDDLEAQDPNPGWTCFGGPGGSGIPSFLGAWAPGTSGGDTPPGTGMLVQPNSKIVLQMHYNTVASPPIPDLSGIDLRIDPSVEKQAALLPWLNPQWYNGAMAIPPGIADVEHSFSFDPTAYMSFLTDGAVPNDTAFDIYGASLHMHTRGTAGQFYIIREGETGSDRNECMLDIPRWDFGWQGMYRFQKVKRFEPGDQLYLECHFDNSEGTTELNWGEGTSDEMCLGFLYVTR